MAIHTLPITNIEDAVFTGRQNLAEDGDGDDEDKTTSTAEAGRHAG